MYKRSAIDGYCFENLHDRQGFAGFNALIVE